MLNTTIGKLVVEDALPEDMKDWAQLSFNKKTLGAFMADLAQRHPDEYRDVTHKLLQIARQGALESGSNSFGLKHIKVSPAAKARRAKLLKAVHDINEDDSLTDAQRNNKLIKTIARAKEGFESELMEEAKAENSPLERMISSGARGNPGSLASLRGGDFQYVDSEGNALPVPIAKSYGEGLDPVSYWAGSFGARQGLLSAKFSTAESGYFAKRLQQAAHRLLVTGIDEDHERDGEIRGMPANSDDPHNEGSLLAHPAGGYAKNTILTPKILQDLKRKGVGRILVRSPIVGGAKDGGLLARDVGIRESGDLPHPGSLVGLLAAQSIAERLSQQALGAKHLGGIAGKGVEQLTQGFPLVEQLVDIPKAFRGGATHAQTGGVVQLIHEAPAGGMYVTVNDQDHYIPVGHTVSVKRGDHIEAGNMLSSGIPNPSEIVKHKGIGEGRRYFTHQLAGVLQQAGVNAHRRNVELVARAMIDHVKMNDEFSDWLPGDVVSYQTLERNWHPREGFKQLEPKAAVGQYLEKPVLHYTVGTKIQPSMIKDMDEFGIKNLTVHENPPPFEPLMVRSEDSLQHDPDWVSQMYGSGLKKNLLKSVHRGATSDEKGTSFVPSLAKGVNFGLVEPFNKLNKKAEESKGASVGSVAGDVGIMMGGMLANDILPDTATPWTQGPSNPYAPYNGGDYSNWAANRLFHEGLGPGSSEDTANAEAAARRRFLAAAVTARGGVPAGVAADMFAGHVINPAIDTLRHESYNQKHDMLSSGLQQSKPPERWTASPADLRPVDENSTLSVLQNQPEYIRRIHAAEILNDKYMQQHRNYWGGRWDETGGGNTEEDTWWNKRLSGLFGLHGRRSTTIEQNVKDRIRPALDEFGRTGNYQKLEEDLGRAHSSLASAWGNNQFNSSPITEADRATIGINANLGATPNAPPSQPFVPGGPGAISASPVEQRSRRNLLANTTYRNKTDQQLESENTTAFNPETAVELNRRERVRQQDSQRALQQQQSDITAVRAANPTDPYLQGQQYAAQFAMDHFPDSRATEHQKNVDFIAQSRERWAGDMQKNYSQALELASTAINPKYRDEYLGIAKDLENSAKTTGLTLTRPQNLPAEISSSNANPSRPAWGVTKEQLQTYAPQKPGPSAKSLGATAAMPQPPKIPTPPKMTTSSPTGKLPLVPGGKS